MPSILLKNTATGQPESIDLQDQDSAIASGKYEPYEGSQIATEKMGTRFNEPSTRAVSSLESGEAFVDPGQVGAEQGIETQKEALSTFDNKALTFAEGATDALTFGLGHMRNETADMRRQINSGAALAGQISGIAIGLATGAGESQLATLGETAGKTFAKQLFGDSALASRALGEAGANLMISTAQATGHQVFDAILENKPIAVEAIAHEAGLGALMGLGQGTLGGLISKGAGALTINEGAELPKFNTEVGRTIDTSINELDTALTQHQTRLGVLRQANADGLLPADFLAERSDALQTAIKAQTKMRNLGNATYALEAGPREAFKWQQALEDYHGAVERLDKVMTPRLNEVMATGQRGELGLPEQGPLKPPGDQIVEPGSTGAGSEDLNKLMESPERQAAYRQLHGKDWEPVQPADQLNGEPYKTSELAGAENLGGKETPTSQNATNAIRKPRADITEVNAELNTGSKFDNLLAGIERKPASVWDDFFNQTDKRVNEIANNPHGAPEVDSAIQYQPSTDVQNNGKSFQDVVDRVNAKANKKTALSADNKVTEQVQPNRTNIYNRPGEFHTKTVVDEPTIVDEKVPASRDESLNYEKTKVQRNPMANTDETLTKHERFKSLIDEWSAESRKNMHGSPAGRAINNIDQMLGDLNVKSNGKLDALGSIDLARAKGFGSARTELGSRFQQAWSYRQLLAEAAKASRSAKLPSDAAQALLGMKPGFSKHGVMDYLRRRMGGRIGSSIGGAMLGHELMGGDLGYYLGAGLALGYTGFAGRVSASTSVLLDKVSAAAETLTKGRRSTVIAQGLAMSKPWAYSDKGPIKDPVQRIQEINFVAAHPELIAQKVATNVGDLHIVHPEIADLLTKAAQNKIMALSIRAPKFMFDKFGQPLGLAAGAMRKFLEYENAVNDLGGTLDAIKSGGITKDAADGLRDGWPAFQQKLASQVLSGHLELSKLNPTQLRQVELVTGADLSGKSDGQYVSRQQMGWVTAAQQSNPQANQQGRPQAFKIGSKSPDSVPTVTQSSNGRAPGN